MRVTMLLADSAQVVGGKLYILGGGWSVTGPQPSTMAVALKLELPRDQANQKHDWSLSLLDTDGEPVTAPTREGQALVKINGTLEVGIPPDRPPGVPLDATLAVQFGPLPLAPGSRFTWKLSIDGESRDDWQVTFATRPEASADDVTVK